MIWDLEPWQDIWCNMTEAGGPDGCRALVLRVAATMEDGSEHVLDTSSPSTDWSVSAGPVGCWVVNYRSSNL